MDMLTAEGRRVVEDVGRRHGVSTDAVLAVLMALVAGQGRQAQFNHPDLGGMGQWSSGGMIMVGDMFNQGLKARIDTLCSELAGLLASSDLLAQPRDSQAQSQSQGGAGVSLFVRGGGSGNWWPEGLGSAASVGGQNDLRYAYFPETRRLAIDHSGRVALHDTGDHRIVGFSQQQSGDQSLTFTSQHGVVRVADLPIVSEDPPDDSASGDAPVPSAVQRSAEPANVQRIAEPAASGDDVFSKIERLADLRQKNILSEAEFETKKAELLSRL